MKKSNIMGVLIIVIFTILLTYTIHLYKEVNHYAGYINERLNNLIKPTSNILQANKPIDDALKSKQISVDELNSIYFLYEHAAQNIGNLQQIEFYVTGAENDGQVSVMTLSHISDHLRVLKLGSSTTGEKMIKLNKNQIVLFHKISQFNEDVSKVLKPTLQQDYNVKGKKWIAVLKQLDYIINQKNYYGTF